MLPSYETGRQEGLTMFWAGFIVGLIVGANVGVFMVALCMAAGRDKRENE